MMYYAIVFCALALSMFFGIYLTLLTLKPRENPTTFQKAESRIRYNEDKERPASIMENKENASAKDESPFVNKSESIIIDEGDDFSHIPKRDKDYKVATVHDLDCIMAGLDPDEHLKEMRRREDDSYRILKRKKEEKEKTNI